MPKQQPKFGVWDDNLQQFVETKGVVWRRKNGERKPPKSLDPYYRCVVYFGDDIFKTPKKKAWDVPLDVLQEKHSLYELAEFLRGDRGFGNQPLFVQLIGGPEYGTGQYWVLPTYSNYEKANSDNPAITGMMTQVQALQEQLADIQQENADLKKMLQKGPAIADEEEKENPLGAIGDMLEYVGKVYNALPPPVQRLADKAIGGLFAGGQEPNPFSMNDNMNQTANTTQASQYPPDHPLYTLQEGDVWDVSAAIPRVALNAVEQIDWNRTNTIAIIKFMMSPMAAKQGIFLLGSEPAEQEPLQQVDGSVPGGIVQIMEYIDWQRTNADELAAFLTGPDAKDYGIYLRAA